MAAGSLLGRLTWRLARERRYITMVNIARCFPELSAAQQQDLVKRCFIDNGIGLIETATGWVRPPAHFLDRLVMKGTEHLEAALAQGKGVLMLGAHYSTLDFGANLLSVHYPFAVTYRAHSNPLFDAFMLRGRLRNCNGVFDRRDIRGAFRHLRQGKILWYAPDQDYGPEQAVFVPFFGHPAATITAASRFAAFNRSPVVLVRQQRLEDGRYQLHFVPLDTVPSGDDTHDATVINAAVEAAIRVAPSQYLWMHKRFKTQPGGKPQSPYIYIRTPHKKLAAHQYAELLAEASPYAASAASPAWLRLHNGLVLREFSGQARGRFRHRHAALQLDSLSKALRTSGIRTVTIDNIFWLPWRNVTAVTCFLPTGHTLAEREIAATEAAAFLALLHASGFHFLNLRAANIISSVEGVGIVDPLQLCKVPGSAAWQNRVVDLHAWLAMTTAEATYRDALFAGYLARLRPFDAEGMRALLSRPNGATDNSSGPRAAPAHSSTGDSAAASSGHP